MAYILTPGNCIGSDGANRIGNALKENDSIEDLDLSDTFLIHSVYLPFYFI